MDYDGRTNRMRDVCRKCDGKDDDNGDSLVGKSSETGQGRDAGAGNLHYKNGGGGLNSSNTSVLGYKSSLNGDDDEQGSYRGAAGGFVNAGLHAGGTTSSVLPESSEGSLERSSDMAIMSSLRSELQQEKERLQCFRDGEEIARLRAEVAETRRQASKLELRKIKYDEHADKCDFKVVQQEKERENLIEKAVKVDKERQAEIAALQAAETKVTEGGSSSSGKPKAAVNDTGKPDVKGAVSDGTVDSSLDSDDDDVGFSEASSVEDVSSKKKKKKSSAKEKKDVKKKKKAARKTKKKQKKSSKSDSSSSSSSDSECDFDLKRLVPKKDRKRSLGYKETLYYSLLDIEKLLEKGESVAPYVGHLRFMAGKDLKRYSYENIVQYDAVVREKAADKGVTAFGKRSSDVVLENLGSDALMGGGGGGGEGLGGGGGEG